MSDNFNDNYIFSLTDDTGMFQHAVFNIPDLREGYTTDDNARALIMAAMLYDKYNDKKYMKLLHIYLAFVLNSQNSNGTFKNFMGCNRNFLEKKGSEDCFGRCILSLGCIISDSNMPENIRNVCNHIMENAMSNISNLNFLRSKAYTILGLKHLTTSKSQNIMNTLAESIVDEYRKCNCKNWHWFENTISYANAIIPYSLFSAYSNLNKKIFLDIAIESMDFLSKVTFRDDYFKPVGCKGWFVKDKEPAEFDEQPLEACSTMLCCVEAYDITKDEKYIDMASKCFEWYHGKNIKGLSLIDDETGGCRDGLLKNGLNPNEGAESIISYCISYLTIEKYKKYL